MLKTSSLVEFVKWLFKNISTKLILKIEEISIQRIPAVPKKSVRYNQVSAIYTVFDFLGKKITKIKIADFLIPYE